MLGIKLSKQHIRNTIAKTRHMANKAYRYEKGLAKDIDQGVRTFKDVYSVLNPALSSMFGDHMKGVSKHVMKGLTGYENIKNQVMNTEENIKHHYNQVVGDLNKKKIDIGL